MPKPYKLSDEALQDVENILDWTSEHFGEDAMMRYAKLLENGFDTVGIKPKKLGSKSRKELGQGIRSFHLRHLRSQVNKPRHLLIYQQLDGGGVSILRVLHDAMDLESHFPEE